MPVTLPNIVVLTYQPITAVSAPEIAIVVVPGLPGQPGTGGGGGSGDLDTAEINATEDIPALSLVTAGGQVGNSSTLSHLNHIVGLSMTAVLNGFVATVVVEGEVTDPSWTWAANQKLFLNGTTLSTTPPTSGFSQHIGLTRNSNTVFIRLQIPVQF